MISRFQNFKRKEFNSYSNLLHYTFNNLTISFAIYFTNPSFYRVTSNYNDISWSRELLCFKQICLSIVRLFFVSPLPYTVSIYISRSKTHVLQLRSESVRFWFSSGYINNLVDTILRWFIKRRCRESVWNPYVSFFSLMDAISFLGKKNSYTKMIVQLQRNEGQGDAFFPRKKILSFVILENFVLII